MKKYLKLGLIGGGIGLIIGIALIITGNDEIFFSPGGKKIVDDFVTIVIGFFGGILIGGLIGKFIGGEMGEDNREVFGKEEKWALDRTTAKKK